MSKRDVWLVLNGEQKLPAKPEQWIPYDGEVNHLLCEAHKALKQTEGEAGHGTLLDLSSFTDPPKPYLVCKGRVVVVANPNAPPEMLGTRTVAGMPIDLWDGLRGHSDQLPREVRMGSVVGYSYQVHKDSLRDLEQLEAFLEDGTGKTAPPANNPRRRMCVLMEFPSLMSDPNRFRRRRKEPAPAAEAPPTEDVTIVTDTVPAVFEWWCGPAPPQDEVGPTPMGRWKMYHPQVCRRLEKAFQGMPSFRAGKEATDVDGIRYMLHHLKEDAPFDYMGKPSREPFIPQNIITLAHPCFSEMDRMNGNCFVQFQKGNPYRRRPARRRPDASEIARRAVMTSEPCSVCFSEDGALTGCNRAHVICKSCLRMGLRSVVGDTMTIENLLCGCFSNKTRSALLSLAQRADIDLQTLIANPPTDRFERQDFDMEIEQTRRQFDLGKVRGIPDGVYSTKTREWFHKLHVKDVAHLYHVCSHPSCADKLDNWMLIDDFDRDYAARGITTWVCPAGHQNCVLPSAEELADVNRNIIRHPEYYIEYMGAEMRRYRLCNQCVAGGVLMIACHDGGCKHWPGSGHGHQHVFCFRCVRVWGRECDHGQRCTDPGIQQVRREGNSLKVGYIDTTSYMDWLNGRSSDPPPTVFECGSVPGRQRQEELGLTDRRALLEESRRGTS